jgi:hypothetical protein
MQNCTAEFARLAASLSGVQCDGNPFVTFTSPFALQNWTLPVIEFVMVVGALATLVHAVKWYRRHGDASNLVVWITGVVALMLIEPIAYFPQWFGLEQSMGLTFVHNQFSVQFLYDRLPLYIIAMYPVFGYLSYVLVQRTGIFTRYKAVVGAATAAFVFHCLFELVDTVGPQWRWWSWNTELSTSVPALGVVPLLNIQAFTVVLPFGMVLGARLVGSTHRRGGWLVARDVLVVSLLVWPLQFLASLPATIVDLLGGSLETARFVSIWLYVAALAGVAAYAYVGSYRARRRDPALVPDDVRRDYFPLVYTAVYFFAAVAFWVAALPDYLAARDGVTASGAPIGSLPYAVVAFVCTIALIVGSYLGTGRVDSTARNETELVAR